MLLKSSLISNHIAIFKTEIHIVLAMLVVNTAMTPDCACARLLPRPFPLYWATILPDRATATPSRLVIFRRFTQK
jgi:hypothetical protein